MDFNKRYSGFLGSINNRLSTYLASDGIPHKDFIYESMRYSLMAGGKRVRPVLSLAVCELFEKPITEVLAYACAIEMIHTYSLIHDDLPSMDNDDYRRGMLTNHKVYGEDIAILAGDALLNYAFEIMIEDALLNEDNAHSKIRAMQVIAANSGVSGMIGGQIFDLKSENKNILIEELTLMHKLKTGALIKASVISAAIICGANKTQLEILSKYAENVGLAFQIKDDILDVEGDDKKLGKSVGSDVRNQKSTYVSILGIEESKERLENLTKEAIFVLDALGENAWFLKDLAQKLLIRDN